MQTKLLWLDMEMTGLDPERDRVLEVATIVTDGDLREIAVGPELVIRQSAETLAAMVPWCALTHGESGLTERSLESLTSTADADALTSAFVRQHFPYGGAILAGNSIHQDRRFIRAWFPELEALLHYRMLDVSAIRIAVDAWYPDVTATRPAKRMGHRALGDIRESIAELGFYRAAVFK